MAKASAEGGATQYVAEGDPVPDDVPEGVRLVGPGAPASEPVPGAADQVVSGDCGLDQGQPGGFPVSAGNG